MPDASNAWHTFFWAIMGRLASIPIPIFISIPTSIYANCAIFGRQCGVNNLCFAPFFWGMGHGGVYVGLPLTPFRLTVLHQPCALSSSRFLLCSILSLLLLLASRSFWPSFLGQLTVARERRFMLHGQGQVHRKRERVENERVASTGTWPPTPFWPEKENSGRRRPAYIHHYILVTQFRALSFHSCSDFGFDFGSHFRFVYFRPDSLGFGVVYACRQREWKWGNGENGKTP